LPVKAIVRVLEEIMFMGKNKRLFVGKAIEGVGWRIWNKKGRKWWGNFLSEYPDEFLDELNGLKKS